jgi:hypothetical protein
VLQREQLTQGLPVGRGSVCLPTVRFNPNRLVSPTSGSVAAAGKSVYWSAGLRETLDTEAAT